jgi:putative hydrolase of HD superfamily
MAGEIDFFLEAGKLKRIGRRGWTFRGVEIPETVADHTFRTALLCMYYGEKFGMDVEKLVSLALLHDLNETETGDSVGDKFKKISDREKFSKGIGAMERVTAGLPKKMKEKYLALWKDENERLSPEGSLARDLNKLELAFQALEYEMGGHPPELIEDMWGHVAESVRDKRLLEVLRKLKKMRPRKRKK